MSNIYVSMRSKNQINVGFKRLNSAFFMLKSVYDPDGDGLIDGNIISIDTSNFNQNLSPSDDTVQKALETIDNITSLGGGEINTASNIGSSGSGVFKQKNGTTLEFYKINPASNRVFINLDGADKLNVDIIESGIDLSSCDNSTSGFISDYTVTNSDLTGLNISGLNNDAGYITGYTETDPVFSASPAANVINTGDGTQFLANDGTYKTMAGGGGGEANTASNIGVSGIGFFKQKAGFNLEFKNINAGSNKVSMTDDTVNNEIDVDIVESNINLSNCDNSTSGFISDYTVTNSDLTGLNISGLNNDAGYITGYTETDPVVGAINGLVKADGVGNISQAVPGTDYQTPLTAGTDYLTPSGDGSSLTGLTKSQLGLGNVPNTDCTNADNISDGLTNAIITLAQETNFETAYTHSQASGNPHNVTKSDIGLGNITNDAQLKRSANDYSGVLEKSSPAGADLILIEDSADSYNKKKVQLSNLPGGGGGGTDSFANSFLHIQDQKSAGTNGQNLTSGDWRTRDINTVLTNQISGASLSGNAVTLPAGTYYCEAKAASRLGVRNKVRIRKTSGTAEDLLIGLNTYSYTNASYYSICTTDPSVYGVFTLSESSTIEIQQRVQSNDMGGVGCNFGVVEVYSDLRIWKVG